MGESDTMPVRLWHKLELTRLLSSLMMVIVFTALAALDAAALQERPSTKSIEMHVLTDEAYGDTRVLVRLPLSYAFPETETVNGSTFTVPAQPDNGIGYRLNQSKFEADFDGFVSEIINAFGFYLNGKPIEPEFGALSIVPVPDHEPLPKGLMHVIAMLDVCTAFPGELELSQLDAVLEVYLPDVVGLTPFDVSFRNSGHLDQSKTPISYTVTNHQSGQPHTMLINPDDGLFEIAAAAPMKRTAWTTVTLGMLVLIAAGALSLLQKARAEAAGKRSTRSAKAYN